MVFILYLDETVSVGHPAGFSLLLGLNNGLAGGSEE